MNTQVETIDQLREREIDRLMLLGTLSSDRKERVRAFARMKELIAQRSARQVEKMESEIK